MSRQALHLFEAFGVELEYMLVDRDLLAVLPRSDEVLKSVAGEYVSEIDRGGISWSNELVLHVIELKTSGPVETLTGLPALFDRHVREINERLASLGGRLMPSAMHPWMDPHRETQLWPHDYSEVYEAYDRIFGCQGHGWSNLQSVHLNLPFADDDEFARLHAAIRLVLPILPALAASSPLVEGRATGMLDSRLEVYRTNSARIPSVTGRVIPEAVFSRRDYEREIFAPMYREIRPLDPQGILQHEWLNARGAIARFDRNTIEIRVIDVQECPLADVAICAAAAAVLRAMTRGRWTSQAEQQAWEVEPLERIFLATLREAEATVIDDQRYLAQFGWQGARPCTAGELWTHLVESLWSEGDEDACWLSPLRHILQHGTLARRLLQAVGDRPDRTRLAETYGRLCDCLARGEMFIR